MTVWLAFLTLITSGYLIPALIAHSRRHHNSASIFWLNFLLGWTIIGWIIALAWACSRVRSFDPLLPN